MAKTKSCEHCGSTSVWGLCIPLPPRKRDRVFYLCEKPCAPLPVLDAIIEAHVR